MALPLIIPLVAAGAAAAGGGLGAATDIGMTRRRRTAFGDTSQYNAEASDFGGYKAGLRDYKGNLNYRREQVEDRGANLADFRRADEWDAQSRGARAGQGAIAGMMHDRAAGKVPSIAGQQAAIDMNRVQAAQGAQASSARGAAGVALAGQTAANNVANAQANISNQAQVNAAQERMAAEGAAMNAYSTMRTGDVSSQVQTSNQAQFQAQQEQAARDANDKRAMGYEQLESDAQKAQLNAKMQQQQILAQSFDSADSGNQQTAAQNSATTKGFFEKIFSSDEHTKIPLPFVGGLPSSPASGPAAASLDVIGPGGGLDANASSRVHSNVATQFQSNPTAAGFPSDTRAKKEALIEQGRRKGLAQARAGARLGPLMKNGKIDLTEEPAAPNQARFVPGRGWVQPGADEQAAREASFNEALDRQAEQDRLEGDQDRRVAEQREADARRASDPAVGLERARGYRATKPNPTPENTTNADAERGVAPGTTDFEQTEPKDGKTPWYMMPVPMNVFGFNSDERAKRAAFSDGFSYGQGELYWASKGEANKETLPDYMKKTRSPVPQGQDRTLTVEGPATATSIDPKARGVRPEPSSDVQGRATERGTPRPVPTGIPANKDVTGQKPRPDGGPVAEANRTYGGRLYAYKEGFRPPEQAPGEPNFGPTTQSMRASPLASTAVKTNPQTGTDVVDRDKAIKLALAGIADLQRQQDETRATLASRKRRSA